MDLNSFSPYVRVAMQSRIQGPALLCDRVLFDYELILVADGVWRFTTEGNTFSCTRGDWIFIRPGQRHRLEVPDGAFVSQPHIHFDLIYDQNSEQIPVSFQDLDQFTEEEWKRIRPDLLKETGAQPVLRLENQEYVKALFYEIIELFTSRPPLYQLGCKEKMLRLLSCLLSEWMAPFPKEKARESRTTVLVKDYLDRNFKNKVTLDALAQQFYINKYHLEKCFKKAYGVAVIQYAALVKVRRAKELLARRLSVHEIGEELGFGSLYSFSRFFKQQTGLSPTAYRQMITKENIINEK